MYLKGHKMSICRWFNCNKDHEKTIKALEQSLADAEYEIARKQKSIAEIVTANQKFSIQVTELKSEIASLEKLHELGDSGIDIYQHGFNYSHDVKIKASDIRNIIGEPMQYTDGQWNGIDKAHVQYIINREKVHEIPYVAETDKDSGYDCDDYAQLLHGIFNSKGLAQYAFGYMNGHGHAYNFFFDRNKKLWIVEPQHGTIKSVEEARKGWTGVYAFEGWII
jgi:hypothetical protein